MNRANALFFKMRKYEGPSILLSLTPIYPTVALFGLRIVVPFNEI